MDILRSLDLGVRNCVNLASGHVQARAGVQLRQFYTHMHFSVHGYLLYYAVYLQNAPLYWNEINISEIGKIWYGTCIA